MIYNVRLPLLFVLILFNRIDFNHAVPIDEEKIVGGQEAVANAYSWEVSLGELKGVPATLKDRQAQSAAVKLDAHFCGGVLLTKDWVLTAAHCVVNDLTKDDPLPANEIGVGVGGRDLVDIYNKGRIPASQVIIKKGYNSENAGSTDDIALVKLSQPVDVTKIKPACLAQTDQPPTQPYQPNLIAIGWGNINALVLDETSGQLSGIQAPQKLKQVAMKDVSSTSEVCRTRPDLICIDPTTPKQGPCKGDSGGSLVWNSNTVVGVTSFAAHSIKISDYKQQICNGDAAYTRTSKNIGWIKGFVKDPFCVK